MPFKGQAKGYYCDGCIAINSKLTNTEKKCTLAEEIGHHETTYGNILDKSIISIKKENIARRWACEKIITLDNFIQAFEYGIKTKEDLAEYFDVTIEFLLQTIEFYKRKYGTYHIEGNYILYFEPNFSILKKF